MSNAHQQHSGNGSTNGKHHVPREKSDVVEQLEGLKASGDKPHGNMPNDVGLMLTLMGIAVIAVSGVCLYFSTVRTICIGLLLLALGSTLAKEGKGEDARHQKLVTGLVMVPIVILAFFSKLRPRSFSSSAFNLVLRSRCMDCLVNVFFVSRVERHTSFSSSRLSLFWF